MSRLWRDELRVALTPSALAWARYGRGFARRGPETGVLPLPAQTDAPAWQPAIDALAQVLDTAGRVQAAVVLSNHFTRYLVLPKNADITGASEWEEYARHRFALAHGPVVQGWSLRLSADVPKAPRVASGVDAALLAQLREMFARKHVPLASIQPYLMVSFNRFRARFEGKNAWFVSHEPGRLSLGLLRQGAWYSIRNRRAGADWQAELAGMIDLENELAGLHEPCCEVWLDAVNTDLTAKLGAYSLGNLRRESSAPIAIDPALALVLN